MALTKNGKFSYGESQADIRAEIADYANRNGNPAKHFADAACSCGNRSFKLLIDDTGGAAVRDCSSCKERHNLLVTTDGVSSRRRVSFKGDPLQIIEEPFLIVMDNVYLSTSTPNNKP